MQKYAGAGIAYERGARAAWSAARMPDTDLHVACRDGEVDRARELIAGGADVNAQQEVRRQLRFFGFSVVRTGSTINK